MVVYQNKDSYIKENLSLVHHIRIWD